MQMQVNDVRYRTIHQFYLKSLSIKECTQMQYLMFDNFLIFKVPTIY